MIRYFNRALHSSCQARNTLISTIDPRAISSALKQPQSQVAIASATPPPKEVRLSIDQNSANQRISLTQMETALNELIEQNQNTKTWLRENKRLNGSMLSSEHHPRLPNGVCTVHIHAGRNNTIISLTDWNQKVLCSTSGGMCGLSGHNRGTPESGLRCGTRIGEMALKRGVRDVFVNLKGFGSGRDPAFRALLSSGLTIHRIADKTPIAHGGCRPKKQRRV